MPPQPQSGPEGLGAFLESQWSSVYIGKPKELGLNATEEPQQWWQQERAATE